MRGKWHSTATTTPACRSGRMKQRHRRLAGVKASPTVRSLRLLRARGYLCKIVEHWNAHAKIRQDLWGCDILAVKLGEAPLLVQTTTRSNQSARLNKLKALPSTAWLLKCGWQIHVHGWREQGCDEVKMKWEG